MVNAQYRYIYGFHFNDKFVPLFYDSAYNDLEPTTLNHPFLKFQYKIDKKTFNLPNVLVERSIYSELINKSIYFAQIRYKSNKKGARKIRSNYNGLNTEDSHMSTDIDTISKRVMGTYNYERGRYNIVDCILTKVPSREIFLKRLEKPAAG